MAAFLARPLDDKVLPILPHFFAPLGLRRVSLSSRVTADLAARAVAAWRVIHGFLVSFSHTSIKSFAHLSVKLSPRNFAPQYMHVP